MKALTSMNQINDRALGPAGRSVFLLTVFASAFLLFQVQPIIARSLLPWFGGGPSVWTVCLLFFQLGLVVGYGYAHLLVSAFRERPGWQISLHLVLVGMAIFTLPIAPDPAMKPGAGNSRPFLEMTRLLAGSVGLPYLLLSASGPLVQHWFSRAAPHRSPFRLYAVSNLGSFLALISYPFLFEVYLTVSGQSRFWSLGFFAYALLICVAASMRLRSAGNVTVVEKSGIAGEEAADRPALSRVARWVLFSACGSILLLAITNQLCQDVAVVPFLWVLPLSLYLLTFIVAFDHARWYSRPLLVPLTAVSVGLVVYSLNQQSGSASWSLVWQIVIYCGTLFLACLVCHGEIVRLKPAPAFLTGFYLAISVGGALGGIFVGLIAPRFFDGYYELHFGFSLLAALMTWQFIRPLLFLTRKQGGDCWRRSQINFRLVGGGLVAWVVALGALAFGLHSHLQKTGENVIASSRDFFGVLKVREDRLASGYRYRTLIHGQIEHGRQLLHPDLRRVPTTYYSRETGIGSTIAAIAETDSSRSKPVSIGVIGLGVGTLAAYARPGDTFRFYEINPQVVELAQSHFTYLSDCRGKVEIVAGDGRISLERELAVGKGHNFDLLVLDAFSSDSIPVHLLTLEAFELYAKHLKHDGILAIHISNQHLDLSDPLRNIAETFGWGVLRMRSIMDGVTYASEWIVMTRESGVIGHLTRSHPLHGWKRMKPKDLLWTDNYGNLFEALK